MKKSTLISICIPAYKRIEYLERLLNSIAIQTFKSYEIVITDDSPDLSVSTFVQNFKGIEKLNYYRNEKPLGTPENWNESIRKANGDWIKLMHDDDWFTSENSLQLFYESTLKKPGCDFFFSAYNNVYESKTETIQLGAMGKILLKLSPLNLFKKQYVGNPSCTLIKRNIDLFYDNRFKWVVDFEYYIRCLKRSKNFFYIDLPLINVGLNEEQVTKYSFRMPEVEIPENHLLIEKTGFGILRNINVYDYYWRLYRNLDIKNEKGISKYYQARLHPLLKQMIVSQSKIPSGLLQLGIFSKITMFFNYLLSLLKKP